jgi:hypothetical protein
MYRLAAWARVAALALGLAPLGCRGTSPPSYPSDPLFVTKRPIEVKPDKNATHLVQHVEPTAIRGARP